MNEYAPQSYERLLGTPGFSDRLLETHFTLYKGYVNNTNAVSRELASLLDAGKESSPAYAELKRRFGWEFNGMRLHELYFGNLAKAGVPLAAGSELDKRLARDFGSRERWEKDFRATAAMRGIGWVILASDPVGGRLFNTWINEHDFGHLAGAVPVLVLDVFEHAFITDYGLKRADYIAAFLAAVDWAAASARLRS